jgi:hypothetical protein
MDLLNLVLNPLVILLQIHPVLNKVSKAFSVLIANNILRDVLVLDQNLDTALPASLKSS